ncbi:glycerol-3-phosphate transporter ATP-binding subunit [compost metagenome]
MGVFKVELSENLGGQTMLHGVLENQNIRVLVDSTKPYTKDQKIKLKINRAKAHLFDKESSEKQAHL